jgi:hypothetical protein
MLQWLIIGALYFVGFGFFGLIGGLGSAGDAIRSWGESAAARHSRAASSS